jgi:hypothetical protein
VRDTDRWITPRVVVALILAAVVVVLAALASVTYLAARGIDPAPTLKLAGGIGTGVLTAINTLLTLSQRRTTTKVERNTGKVVPVLEDLTAAIDKRTRAAPPPPVPPAAPRVPAVAPPSGRAAHRYPDTGAAPLRGS